MKTGTPILALAIWLLSATGALASDGVIEINAAAAAAGGITPGDAPGYPVTISRGGSYRLTGDLTSSSRAVVLVDITADRVTLDLNGFTVGACLSGLACGIGGANAIQAGNLIRHMKVHNGVVAGAGGVCIVTGVHAVLEDLRIQGCGNDGIRVQEDSQISHVNVADVARFGITTGSGVLLKNSTISGSGEDGVYVGFNTWLIDNVIRNNKGAITAGSGATYTKGGYRGCLITQNDGFNEVQPIASPVRDMGQNVCGSDTVCP